MDELTWEWEPCDYYAWLESPHGVTPGSLDDPDFSASAQDAERNK